MSRKIPDPGDDPTASEADAQSTRYGGATELAELLRSVLLSVRDTSSEAQPLTDEAEEAIAQFRSIDAALAVATVFAPLAQLPAGATAA